MNRKFTQAVAIVLAVLIFMSVIFAAISVFAEEDVSVEDIESKLSSITEEEKEILEYLFLQVQEIDILEREEVRLNKDVEDLSNKIYSLEEVINKEEIFFEKNKQVLKEVLQTYQVIGPASYIEIILKSDNLKSLLRRINILRDLAKNTDELLISIEETMDRLEKEKGNLETNLKALEEVYIKLVDNLNTKKELVKEKEEYLESLLDEREYYEEYLATMEKAMEELAVVIEDLSKEFSTIIEKGNLPADAFKPSISLQGIKGTIDEKIFNEIIHQHEGLPYMELKFNEDEVIMTIPDRELIFIGDFVVEDKQVIKFNIEEASFYGMKLEKGTIEDLLKEGELVLDLKVILDNNQIKSIRTYEGFVELLVQIRL